MTGWVALASARRVSLYLFGWRGLVIDADPTHLGKFKAARPNDIVVHRAVAETPAEMPFYTFKDSRLNTLCAHTPESTRLAALRCRQHCR